MVLETGMRPIRRDHNGLMIFLRLEDWPDDVPLPNMTTQMVTGAGPFPVTWKILLEPDKTVEMIAGWFIIPQLSIEDTFNWYQAEMEKLGWVEVQRAATLPTWAMLRYCQPEANLDSETHVVIDIRQNRYLNRTQPMIRRVTIHPWPLSGEEEGEMGVDQEPLAGESTVDDYESGEDAVEFEMALPHSGD